MPTTNTNDLAREVLNAYKTGGMLAAPSSSDPEFDMDAAYAVEAEFMRLRQSEGHRPVGVKVGYANKATWRVLKLETLVWAHMYDDTVLHASGPSAEFKLPPRSTGKGAPKLEPEIVFKLKRPIETAGLDAAAVLDSVEWLALGFEIIDCPFPDWNFKPVDFVAAFGLHVALVVGEPLVVEASKIPGLAENLASFKVQVLKDGQLVEEGSGKNSLRNPALCLAELAGAVLRRTGSPLQGGDLVSSGTLTAGHLIQRGEVWTGNVDGLTVSSLTLRGA